MIGKRLAAAALAVGLLCGMAGEAAAAIARDDHVRAVLVPAGDGGFKVVLRFGELAGNDRLTRPVLDRKVLTTRGSEGIKRVMLKGGGRKGPFRVVIRLTDRFAQRILTNGRATTEFAYRITDSCRKDRCGGPTSRARVQLRVVSPH